MCGYPSQNADNENMQSDLWNTAWPALNLSDRSVLEIAQVVAVALSITVISIGVYRVFSHPLAHIPGPFFAKLTHLWQTKSYFTGQWHSDVLKIHEKYGPVVRISPDEISFVDGDAMKRLYGHVKPCTKTKWYDTWYIPPAGHGLFSTQDQEQHAQMRRLASNAYSMSSILTYEKKIQAILNDNWTRFREFAKSGKAIDMDHWSTFFAYDVVSELALGNALGMVKTGSDVNNTIKSVLGLFFFASNMGYMPLQNWWITNRATQWLITNFGDPTTTGEKFRLWLTDSVAKRYYAEKKPIQAQDKDMLQHFIEAKDRDGNPNTFYNVMGEARNVLGAGGDTTAIGIRALMIFLMENPAYYKRIQQEVDEFYNRNITDGEITFQQCLSLPFFQAVVKETGRVYPSIVYQIPRYVPPEGITIAGYAIPPGTPAGISAMAMNRSKQIFGEDANVFRPERWLENEPRARYMDSLLATFGYGSRTCIGKNIALVEMNKYVAQCIRHFDFEFANKEHPYVVKSMWFAMQLDMFVKFSDRNKW